MCRKRACFAFCKAGLNILKTAAFPEVPGNRKRNCPRQNLVLFPLKKAAGILSEDCTAASYSSGPERPVRPGWPQFFDGLRQIATAGQLGKGGGFWMRSGGFLDAFGGFCGQNRGKVGCSFGRSHSKGRRDIVGAMEGPFSCLAFCRPWGRKAPLAPPQKKRAAPSSDGAARFVM